MELARKIIAMWLALACSIQSMLPCQCRLASLACTAECCHDKDNPADGDDRPVHQCSHSHAADGQASRFSNVLVTSNDNVPVKSPGSPQCPRCQGESWIVPSKSFDRDEFQQIPFVPILLRHPWHIDIGSLLDSACVETGQPILAKQSSQHCRMQV